jgi:hypothetical protein
LDQLVAAGAEMRDTHLQSFENMHKKNRDYRRDQDLLRPFREAEIRAARMEETRKEFKLITAHVDDVHLEYQKFWAARISSAPHKENGDSGRVSDSPTTKLARRFAEEPATLITGDVRAIKASYAYTKYSTTFAFAVAFHDLCALKATSLGDVPTYRLIAETMDIRSSFLRVLDRSSSG